MGKSNAAKRRAENEVNEAMQTGNESVSQVDTQRGLDLAMTRSLNALANFVEGTLSTCMQITDIKDRLVALDCMGRNPLITMYGAAMLPNQVAIPSAASSPTFAQIVSEATAAITSSSNVDMIDATGPTQAASSQALYFVQLKAISGHNLDPLAIYRHAMKGTKSQIDDYTVMGNDIRIKVPNLVYASEAVAKLNSSSFGEPPVPNQPTLPDLLCH